MFADRKAQMTADGGCSRISANLRAGIPRMYVAQSPARFSTADFRQRPVESILHVDKACGLQFVNPEFHSFHPVKMIVAECGAIHDSTFSCPSAFHVGSGFNPRSAFVAV